VPAHIYKQENRLELQPVSSIILPQPIYDEIIAHALEGKPEEICGILRGRGDRAFELVRGQNVAEDRINDYVLDSQTLLRQFDFEDAGDTMIGIYHSHPTSVAYPSASDAWNAHYPNSIYLICSLEHEGAPVVRGFRLMPHFLELDMAALRESLDFYETRPELFGFFQDRDRLLPLVLESLAEMVSPPFYLVYQVKDSTGEIEEHRVVSVEKCRIQVRQA
jgi:proteasome lid subunit RPN8/RPN11